MVTLGTKESSRCAGFYVPLLYFAWMELILLMIYDIYDPTHPRREEINNKYKAQVRKNPLQKA